MRSDRHHGCDRRLRRVVANAPHHDNDVVLLTFFLVGAVFILGVEVRGCRGVPLQIVDYAPARILLIERRRSNVFLQFVD